jgi:hypothetical protein
MAESILDKTKKALGLAPDDTSFDVDIIIHINSTFATLFQLGVGPVEPFFIEDNTSNWEEFIGDRTDLNSVKSYMYLKVRVLFDPPTTSFALESFNKMIQEYEWRLNVQADRMDAGQESIYFWDLTGGRDFPLEAPVDAYGIDFSTGRVYRKTNG